MGIRITGCANGQNQENNIIGRCCSLEKYYLKIAYINDKRIFKY